MKSINFTFLVAFTFLTSLFFDVEVRAFDPGEGPCPIGFKKIFLRETGIRRIYDCKFDSNSGMDSAAMNKEGNRSRQGDNATQGDVPGVEQQKQRPASRLSRKDSNQASQNRGNESKGNAPVQCDQGSYPNGQACLPCPKGQSVAGIPGNYCNQNFSEDKSKEMSCEKNETLHCPDTNEKCYCIKEQAASSSPETPPSPAAKQCASELDKYHNDCLREADEAMTSCNDENEAMQAAANAAKTIGAGSVMSIQVACSKINDISKLANEAFAGWKSLCSANQGGCQTNCGKAKEIILGDCLTEDLKETYRQNYLPVINKNIVQCESYKQKLFDAAQHAVAAIAQTKASEQCKKDTTADLEKTINLDQCKNNPNTPMCMDMQKCSNPTFAAQNPVCYCVSNPTSPTCLQVNGNFGNKGLSMGATIPGVKNEKGENLPGMNSNGNAEANPFPGFNNGGGHSDGASVGGRQGDAGSAGSGKMGADNGAGNGKGGYGSGNEKDGIKVNSGTYGGGGSGYFGPNYGGAGGGALGGANNPTGARRDIAKFDPRKYIVGQGGQGEYLNGPNGNIFKIMKLRYEENRSTFLPETFFLKK